MPDISQLDTHRRIMASAEDGDVCWWYLGTTFAQVDGYPDIAALQAETIMIYRTETLSRESYRIHWREVGYFRDPVSGEVAEEWLNPITGEVLNAPRSFEEGPSFYTVTAAAGGLRIELEQAHATVRGIDVSFGQAGPGRVSLTQRERKVRGFPLPDGTMPQAGSAALSETTTVLSLFADRAQLNAPADAEVSCSGLYSFELSNLPPWMGFGAMPGRTMVKGIMRKTHPQEHLNASAWTRLSAAFPSYFTGARLTPPW
jgi:hypothetical protein